MLKKVDAPLRPTPRAAFACFRSGRHDVNAIADELDALSKLATRINLLPGPNSHAPGNWYHERDEIGRALARAVGRLRKELGIRTPTLSFTTPASDSGVRFTRQARVGSRDIPVERRAPKIADADCLGDRTAPRTRTF